MGGRLLKGIQAFYREANACVRVGGEFSESFAVEVGVRQGRVNTIQAVNSMTIGCVNVRVRMQRGSYREALWNVLKIYGVGGRLLKGIQAFYREANACVRVGGGGSGKIQGVEEGDGEKRAEGEHGKYNGCDI